MTECQKTRARKAENVLSNMTRQRKAKDFDQQAPLKRDNSAERQYATETGKVHLDKKTVLRVSTTQQEFEVTIESVTVYWHLTHRKYFKRDQCHMALTKEESICQYKEKGERKQSEKEKVTAGQ